VRLVTFCSGTGGRWAERRTTVFVDDEVAIETVALWVYIDADGRPAPLEQWFFAHYEVAANGRKVSGRLQHRPPPADAERRPWPLRATDFDVLAHANNAASWQAFEDELARRAPRRRVHAAEIEYRAAIDPDDQIELVSTLEDRTLACWLMRDDEVRVSSRIELD
jgi:acyl-ACP thioesterase